MIIGVPSPQDGSLLQSQIKRDVRESQPCAVVADKLASVPNHWDSNHFRPLPYRQAKEFNRIQRATWKGMSMVLPASIYAKARRDAAFHVQVELLEVPTVARTPSAVTVSARVVNVFRARTPLHSGDTIRFEVSVCRRGDVDLPGGGTIWTDYDDLTTARFMEVYLDGEPPECNIALWSSQLIDFPSSEPEMKVS